MMPPKKILTDSEHNIDAWLMSYADMITLILCFFIIIVSVSEPKKDRFSQVTESMSKSFGSVNLTTPLRGIVQSLQATVERNHMLKDVAIDKTDDGMIVEVASSSFFAHDTADLNGVADDILTDLITTLNTKDFADYNVIIEGHTSDEVPQSKAYPSNWELSSARAARLVRYFIDHGMDASRLRAVGYADTKPKVPNLDANNEPIPENRIRNDRMVISIAQ